MSHPRHRDTLGAVGLVVALSFAALVIQGCCLFGTTRTVYTPLPHIPVGEPPSLSGDEVSDFPIIAADALRSRRLIMRYNTLAEKINTEHGVETVGLDSIDLSEPNPTGEPTP